MLEKVLMASELDNALGSLNIKTASVENTLIEEAKKSDMKLNAVAKAEIKPIEINITDMDRTRAVNTCLVPEQYKDVKFDTDKIRKNLMDQYKRSNGIYKIYKFKEYVRVCSEIISTIRTGQVPRRSWLIGAPNGFGKASLVNECLILMQKQGWTVAPYISLHELAEIRVAEEQRLMRPFSYKATQGIYDEASKDFISEKQHALYMNGVTSQDIIKKPTIITSNYSWSEYINAKCLFVHFTDAMSKDLESHVLYQLLSIRGAKGLPTIAFISTSLDLYIKDVHLKELIWDEIISSEASSDSYDRITHVSCYKRKDFSLNAKEKPAESNTGIVD